MSSPGYLCLGGLLPTQGCHMSRSDEGMSALGNYSLGLRLPMTLPVLGSTDHDLRRAGTSSGSLHPWSLLCLLTCLDGLDATRHWRSILNYLDYGRRRIAQVVSKDETITPFTIKRSSRGSGRIPGGGRLGGPSLRSLDLDLEWPVRWIPEQL